MLVLYPEFKADQLFRLGVDRILMCSQLLDGDFSVSVTSLESMVHKHSSWD